MRDILNDHFDKSELEDLCFDLGVDYENLRGERKTDKARELLLLIYRQDRLPDLLTAVQTARPHLTFPNLPALHQQATTWRKASTRAERIRHTLIQNVRSVWVDGVLHHANDILLSLDLAHTPDALQRDVPLMVRDEAAETAVNSSLVEIFQEHGRRLLILGEPGSGKTFTLLQLAEALLDQAEHDLIHPVPVVLNLSSWALVRKPLPEWIAEEMLSQYQVARKVTTAWLEEDELLLMLDGLDEVAEAHRNACLVAINAFMAEHQAELVVCSRVGDYEQLEDRLNVSAAVRVQPLTDDEIARYLSQPGLALQAILAVDSDLHELARSPLMLTVMTLAYRGLSQEELMPLDSVEERRQHLFGKYVEQVFRRRPLDALNNNVKWLTHLAKGMSQERQSVFYIERLQPTWLLSPKWYLTGVGLFVGLFTGLIFGLVSGLISGLIAGLFFGFVSGLVNGSTGGLLGGASYLLSSFVKNKRKRFWATVISAMMITTLIFGLLYGLGTGLFAGLLYGLLFGLIIFNQQISTIEVLNLKIPARRAWFIKFVQGTFLGLLFNLINWLGYRINGMSGGLLSGWVMEPVIGSILQSGAELFSDLNVRLLIFGLGSPFIGFLIASITFIQPREIERKSQPNQGVLSSAKNALGMLIVTTLFLGGHGALIDSWLLDSIVGTTFFANSMVLLPLAFFYYGGATIIKHYILRFLLARQGTLPFKLTPFLDAMSERIILRKVGSGYIFIHRYLLEYFAALDSDSTL